MYEMTIQCVATDEAIDFCDLLAEQIARFFFGSRSRYVRIVCSRSGH